MQTLIAIASLKGENNMNLITSMFASVLPRANLLWGSVQNGLTHLMLATSITIPNSEALKAFKDLSLTDMSRVGGPANDVAHFYVYFNQYLNIEPGLAAVWGNVLGFISWVFYIVAKSLEIMYYDTFKLFQWTGGPGSIGSNNTIKYVYRGFLALGWSAFVIALIIYGMQTAFGKANTPLHDKTYNIILILVFLIAIPSGASLFGNGLAKISGNASNSGISSMADQAVIDNTISIPSAIMDSISRQSDTLNVPDNAVSYLPAISGTKYRPILINQESLNNQQKHVWTGLPVNNSGFNDYGNFLLKGGGFDNLLTRDKIDDLKDTAKANKEHKASDGFKKKFPTFNDSTFGAASWSLGIFKYLTANADGLDVFGYYINTSRSDASQLQQFPQFKKDFLTQAVSTVMGILNSQYAYYSIDWFGIIIMEAFLCFALSAFIIKLVKAWYKTGAMYATSGWFLLKNSNDPNKVKSFVMNFFGLFEMVVIDWAIVKIWFSLNGTLIHFVKVSMANAPGYASGFMSFSLVQAFITFIFEFALFQAIMNGLDAINEQISGNSNKVGANQSFLDQVMALRTAGAAVSGTVAGTKAIGRGAAKGFHATKRAVGGYKKHGGLTGLASEGAGKVGQVTGYLGNKTHALSNNHKAKQADRKKTMNDAKKAGKGVTGQLLAVANSGVADFAANGANKIGEIVSGFKNGHEAGRQFQDKLNPNGKKPSNKSGKSGNPASKASDKTNDDITNGDHGPENITNGDHGTENITNGDHGTDNITNGDRGTENITNGDHGTDNITNGNHGTENITNGDHGTKTLAQSTGDSGPTSFNNDVPSSDDYDLPDYDEDNSSYLNGYNPDIQGQNYNPNTPINDNGLDNEPAFEDNYEPTNNGAAGYNPDVQGQNYNPNTSINDDDLNKEPAFNSNRDVFPDTGVDTSALDADQYYPDDYSTLNLIDPSDHGRYYLNAFKQRFHANMAGNTAKTRIAANNAETKLNRQRMNEQSKVTPKTKPNVFMTTRQKHAHDVLSKRRNSSYMDKLAEYENNLNNDDE